MVDDFDGDAAGFRFVKGAGDVAMQTFPRFPIDLGTEHSTRRSGDEDGVFPSRPLSMGYTEVRVSATDS